MSNRVMTVRFYLNCEPGYTCRLEQPHDIQHIIGCIEGELDWHEEGLVIQSIWPEWYSDTNPAKIIIS